jgi:hypothetical protein
MKYIIWRLLGRRFWIKLTSHWKDRKEKGYYSEWLQKKDMIRDYHAYSDYKVLEEKQI